MCAVLYAVVFWPRHALALCLQFYEPSEASRAKDRLDGYNLDGRNISVLYAQVRLIFSCHVFFCALQCVLRHASATIDFCVHEYAVCGFRVLARVVCCENRAKYTSSTSLLANRYTGGL